MSRKTDLPTLFLEELAVDVSLLMTAALFRVLADFSVISIVILRFYFEGGGLIAALHRCLSRDGAGLHPFCNLLPQRLNLFVSEQLDCLWLLFDAQLHRCYLVGAVLLIVPSELRLSEVYRLMCVLFVYCFSWLGLYLRSIYCQIDDKFQPLLEFPIDFSLFIEYSSQNLFYLAPKPYQFIKYDTL